MQRCILVCLLLLFVSQAAGQARAVQPLANQPLNFNYRYPNEREGYTYVYPNGGAGDRSSYQTAQGTSSAYGVPNSYDPTASSRIGSRGSVLESMRPPSNEPLLNVYGMPIDMRAREELLNRQSRTPAAENRGYRAPVPIYYNNAPFTLCKHSGAATTCRKHTPGDPADRPGHSDYDE